MKRPEFVTRIILAGAGLVATGCQAVNRDAGRVDQEARTPECSGYVDVTMTVEPNHVTQMFLDTEGKPVNPNEMDEPFQGIYLEKDVRIGARTLYAEEDICILSGEPARGNQ